MKLRITNQLGHNLFFKQGRISCDKVVVVKFLNTISVCWLLMKSRASINWRCNFSLNLEDCRSCNCGFTISDQSFSVFAAMAGVCWCQ